MSDDPREPETGVEFASFDTAIGRCAIAWTLNGVRAVRLPDRSEAATRAALRALLPAAVPATTPPQIATVVERVRAVVAGCSSDDLADVALDTGDLGEFERRVYAGARTLPPGTTLTYGQLAARIGAHGAARAVGRALARNRFPPVVPCHRVVAAGGAVGGFSASGGATTKRALLHAEATGRNDSLDVAQ